MEGKKPVINELPSIQIHLGLTETSGDSSVFKKKVPVIMKDIRERLERRESYIIQNVKLHGS